MAEHVHGGGGESLLNHGIILYTYLYQITIGQEGSHYKVVLFPNFLTEQLSGLDGQLEIQQLELEA